MNENMNFKSKFLTNSHPTLFSVSLACFSLLLLSAAGCKKDGSGSSGNGNAYLDIGTSPAGGVFNPVGNSLAEGLNKNKGDNSWTLQAKGSKGSQENIRKLDSGDFQLAISNSAITHFAANGEGGWDKKYDVKTLVTLAPNVAMFVTRKDSGIKSIADLKGKKVVCGPPGAGFEMFVEPLTMAHGVKFSDFTVSNAGQNDAVDMLADGQADAAFLGGAIPAPSLIRLCNEQDVLFIPFAEEARKKLATDYPFFWELKIPQAKYKDLEGDYDALNVGSMHVITSGKLDEETAYQLTKTIWESREGFSHPVLKKFINEKNAARFTGTPFHDGAVKFYKEIGIWPETEIEGKKSKDEPKVDGGK